MRKMLSGIIAAAALALSASALAADPAAQKAELRKMCDEALATLFKAKPAAKAEVQKAAGYGCFTSFGISFFVGGEETQLRRDLQRDIVDLRAEIGRLFDTEEIRFREDLSRDIVHLRRQIGELVHAEELQFRKQFQHEIALLRADVAALAAELRQRDARNAAVPPPAEQR